MVKKTKNVQDDDLSVEEIDQSYHSSSDDDAPMGQGGIVDYSSGDGPMGNYESDDSSENDQHEFNQNIKAQKEEAMALNNTWGTKKGNFYGRNKDSDEGSDTDDDQDEEEQARRLQTIKAMKMKRFMQQQEQNAA